MRTRRPRVFLGVPGLFTANAPEIIGIASVLKDFDVTSVESDMAMVSVKIEWVDKGVASDVAELAGQVAMADAIDWSAVTACPPSAVPIEWIDAYGALAGTVVKWPAVGLLLTNSRKVSATTVLERMRMS
jgi:hypothetical protein